MPPDGISTGKAATRLGVTPGTVRKLLAEGKLSGWRVGVRQIVAVASIDEYRARHAIKVKGQGGPPAPPAPDWRARMRAACEGY